MIVATVSISGIALIVSPFGGSIALGSTTTAMRLGPISTAVAHAIHVRRIVDWYRDNQN